MAIDPNTSSIPTLPGVPQEAYGSQLHLSMLPAWWDVHTI